MHESQSALSLSQRNNLSRGCFEVWLNRRMAHVDYTENSGIDRLDALLPDEADKLRKTPFAVIQV